MCDLALDRAVWTVRFTYHPHTREAPAAMIDRLALNSYLADDAVLDPPMNTYAVTATDETGARADFIVHDETWARAYMSAVVEAETKGLTLQDVNLAVAR